MSLQSFRFEQISTVSSNISFDGGALVLSDRISDLVTSEKLCALSLFGRHLSCDWGHIDEDRAALNHANIYDGGPIISRFKIKASTEVVIVKTDGSRLVTRIHFESETL